MSSSTILRHVRRMCRGFGSVPVGVGSSFTAPDGQTRRGLVRIVERLSDDGVGQIVERSEVLTVPTADVLTVARGMTITVGSAPREVRDKLAIEDGTVTELVLAGG